MNSRQKHHIKWHVRQEVKRMLNYRGLTLQTTKHNFQVHGKIGTLFQSHDIYEIKEWILTHKGLLTSDIKDAYCDDKVCAVKYKKVVNL